MATFHFRQSDGLQFSVGLRTLVPAAPAAVKQKSGPISKPEAPSPMAPPTAPPTVSSTSVAPSTPSGGGCPPPPPPPPPPVPAVGGAKKQDEEIGEEGGGGLAAALQGAQLRKVAQVSRTSWLITIITVVRYSITHATHC